jgi:hypothetical protein
LEGEIVHIHVRIQHWVLWWFYLGVICGAVAIVNILFRNLTRSQEQVILEVGILFWVLGGIACYGYEGVRIEQRHQSPPHDHAPQAAPQTEWHPASDFVLPGNRKSLLPPKY